MAGTVGGAWAVGQLAAVAEPAGVADAAERGGDAGAVAAADEAQPGAVPLLAVLAPPAGVQPGGRRALARLVLTAPHAATHLHGPAGPTERDRESGFAGHSVYRSVSISIYLLYIYLSIYLYLPIRERDREWLCWAFGLSVCQYIYLPAVYIPIHLSVSTYQRERQRMALLGIWSIGLSAYLPTCCIYPSIYLSVSTYLSIHLLYLPIYCIYLSTVCLPIYISICLSVSPSV